MDNNIFIVTTFAKDHIPIYGRQLIDNFEKFWPWTLNVFAEDFTKKDLPGNYNLYNFFAEIPEHKIFLNYVSDLIVQNQQSKKSNSYKKALRWSFKSFVILHCLEKFQGKTIVWIDGDVRTKHKIPSNFIHKLLDNNFIMAYRQKIFGETHIESGLVIINTNHFLNSELIQHYKNGYVKYKVLDLKKPWDGFWLGKFLDEPKIARACSLTSPFSNVSVYLKHDSGKDKFKNTSFDKYSGRKLN